MIHILAISADSDLVWASSVTGILTGIFVIINIVITLGVSRKAEKAKQAAEKAHDHLTYLVKNGGHDESEDS